MSNNKIISKTTGIYASIIQSDGSMLPGDLFITYDNMLGLVLRLRQEDLSFTCVVDVKELKESLDFINK